MTPAGVRRDGEGLSRNVVVGGIAILVLALVAQDLRVLLVGVPAAVAMSLSAWAEHRA